MRSSQLQTLLLSLGLGLPTLACAPAKTETKSEVKTANDEKKAELKPMLDDMKRIMNRFSTTGYGDSERAGLRAELEKIKRLIANDFYYNKIKESVPQEQVNLGG